MPTDAHREPARDTPAADLRREQRETHIEAVVALGAVVALQLALAVASLANGWKLAGLRGWVWLIPAAWELGILAALVVRLGRGTDAQAGGRRRLVLAGLAVLGAFNALALVALMVSLIALHPTSGGQLLFEAASVWLTNVVAFGLVFWELDRGGPRRRSLPDPPPADFQFPQMENPDLATPGWRPRMFDYVYVSFTNATAFSPTDSMPLSRRAKALMLVQSAISIVTILLVTARAVNVLH